jgi:hypothetical protein
MSTKLLHQSKRIESVLGLAMLLVGSVSAAELLHQEGFNTDGIPAGRYTMTGKDVFEVPRIQSELGFYDQKGPLYWAHNFEVSYVGNPNIPARRMLFPWKTDAAGPVATEDFLQVFDASINWLLEGKANATIVVDPSALSIGELADRLMALGHTVVDDDSVTYPDEQDVPGDLFIHGPGAANPSRFAMVAKPVINMNELDYDDMLVGSIGTTATFEPGNMTISTPGHPAAGGKTGSFAAFTAPSPQPFGLVGSFLPPGAITVATIIRIVPPAINNLADVDAVIAGTKQHEETTEQVTELDFSDGSLGNWFSDFPVPGGYAGNWGLRITNQITVDTAGTYRFALGSDDGARLKIDLDRNGITSADTVIDDAGPHGHQIVYADVTFPASGNYDFEVLSYNSGGGGSLEVSVAIVPTPVPDDALESGYWEVLSTVGSLVRLTSDATVTSYIAVGPNVEDQVPLIVLLNGPNDNPPGAFYDGGPFTGFEGTGFIGASGLNKWAYPDETPTYRALQLRPVDIAGKTNVKLTIALAATVVDFETSDLLDVVVYTNGVASNPTTLAHFRGVANAVQPWLADEMANFNRRLTKQFADFTYDIPPGATDLVVEIRAATSWWTEIAAFDNIRITAGTVSSEMPTIGISKQGTDIVLSLANGVLERTLSLDAPIQWQEVPTTGGTLTIPAAQLGSRAFFRAKQ